MRGFAFDARARRLELLNLRCAPATLATAATDQREMPRASQLSRLSHGANRNFGPVSTGSVATVASVARTLVEFSQPVSLLTDVETERAGLAADSVPAVYLDIWSRLQCQKPFPVDSRTWQRAIIDAGLFLDQWGALASQFGWTLGDLFDVPSGLVWFIGGSTVEALGPDHARTADNRIFDRTKGAHP